MCDLPLANVLEIFDKPDYAIIILDVPTINP